MSDTGSGAQAVPDLHAEVDAHSWYHTIELAAGVETPGWFDLRPAAAKVLPPRLTGRCLDVATFDGFLEPGHAGPGCGRGGRH